LNQAAGTRSVPGGHQHLRSTAVRRHPPSSAKGLWSAAGCLAALVVLGGCAAPGYNPTRIESELVKAGTTPKQASCVADQLRATFDLNQLGSHSAPSAIRPTPKPGDPPGTKYESEDEKAVDVIKGCGIKLPLDPILPR
jgi:hypothetical protein